MAEGGLWRGSGKLDKEKCLHPPAGDLCPHGHNIIGSRWAFKPKADNSRMRRDVALGRGQLPGVDCTRLRELNYLVRYDIFELLQQ